MRRFRSVWLSMVVIVLASASLAAQPPDEGPDRPDRRRERFGMMMRNLPVMAALDDNDDGEISAEEIAQATAALKKLDENEDGKLTTEELRPQFPRGGFDGPRDGRRGGPEFRGPDDGPGLEGEEGPDAPRRPRRFRGPDGPPGVDGPEGGAPPDGPGPDGPPADERGGRNPRRGGGFGPPNPGEIVDRFMEHDADADGKLSRDELMKAAEAMPRGPGRGNRDRGDRPARPQRPE